MAEEEQWGLRRDAARNVRRILDAGRAVLREKPLASVEEIARAANLGVATVYRRFPTREVLVRAVFYDLFDTDLAPALARAEQEPDPRVGLSIAFEAAARTAVSASVPFSAGMSMEMIRSFTEPVGRLIARSQRAGLVRADLDPDADPLRLLLMLLSVIPTLSKGSDGWNRYLRLMMDSLNLVSAGPLPPPEAVIDPFQGR
jgi:AcrR family transcriptional regulator